MDETLNTHTPTTAHSARGFYVRCTCGWDSRPLSIFSTEHAAAEFGRLHAVVVTPTASLDAPLRRYEPMAVTRPCDCHEQDEDSRP